MIDARWVALGYQQITALTSAVGLAAPAGVAAALIRCETANVRWRDDGIAPTTTIGQLMTPSDAPLWYPGPLANLQFIAVSGSPVLDVCFYR